MNACNIFLVYEEMTNIKWCTLNNVVSYLCTTCIDKIIHSLITIQFLTQNLICKLADYTI